jgi:hypothetical protein
MQRRPTCKGVRDARGRRVAGSVQGASLNRELVLYALHACNMSV